MSTAQDYYEQVLAMGHTPENALLHTRQHYPDFTPNVAGAVPAAQPLAHPAIVDVPASNAYAPTTTTPVPSDGTTPAMWGAVGCIVFALLLSMAGQFSHAWTTYTDQEGYSMGLTTVLRDCSFSSDVEECKQSTYALYSEDWMSASYPKDGEGVGDVITGEYDDYCNNLFVKRTENGASQESAGEARDSCLEAPAAGATASLVLWAGSIGALLGTVMLSAAAIGRSLPLGAERYGKWAGVASGALIVLAVLVWWILMPETTIETSAGMGVWMTVLGGVLGLVAGALAFLDQK